MTARPPPAPTPLQHLVLISLLLALVALLLNDILIETAHSMRFVPSREILRRALERELSPAERRPFAAAANRRRDNGTAVAADNATADDGNGVGSGGVRASVEPSEISRRALGGGSRKPSPEKNRTAEIGRREDETTEDAVDITGAVDAIKEEGGGGGGEGGGKDEEGDGETERCVAVAECEVCSGPGLEGCEETGRRQQFECRVTKGEKEIKRYNVYKKCHRTAADEEFLMLRMQVSCLFLGALSMMSVRRQKRVTASLFDQRRRRESARRAAVANGGSDEGRRLLNQQGAANEISNGGDDDSMMSVSSAGTSTIEMV